MKRFLLLLTLLAVAMPVRADDNLADRSSGQQIAAMLAPIVFDKHHSAGGTFTQGVSFRATAAFVNDYANTSYDLGGSDPSNYPYTPVCNGTGCTAGNSAGIGYSSFSGCGLNTRDRSTTPDARIAGTQWSAICAQGFSVELPAAGTYYVSIALGDPSSNPANLETAIRDGSATATILATIGPTSPGVSTPLVAADGVAYSATNWVSTGSAKTIAVTTTQTKLWFDVFQAGSNPQTYISYLCVKSTPGGC